MITEQVMVIIMIVLFLIFSIGGPAILIRSFKNKDIENRFVLNIVSILIVIGIISLIVFPYGLSYPDPVGSGLTMFFGIGLIIISIISGIVSIKKYKKHKKY